MWGGDGGGGAVEGKVIVSVPDVHSRKPNLRGLFEGLLPERYEALEVFARNLTAGWWAWGDEVLLFQRRECWVDGDEDDENSGDAS
jgi:N6-adenosine-specific RNA methylase IME4